MEGGGEKRDSRHARHVLREGMNEFLHEIREAARTKAVRWKLVPSGSRDAAFAAFQQACSQYDNTVVVLLVDSESPVHTSPRNHLVTRETKWDLAGISEEVVHLMIQSMETWIVADPDNLSQYYDQHFQRNALPSPHNLEGRSKVDISNSLKRATQRTSKGAYHKIRHASDLLKRIDPQLVRERCSSCNRLFNFLLQIIEAR